MADLITLFTHDGTWKADVKAWKNNFLVYKSIGPQVTVYHREQTKNTWGNTVTDWVQKPAKLIDIADTYKAGPGSASRRAACPNASYCEEKLWAVGVSLTIPANGDPSLGGAAPLEVDSVTGTVMVLIGEEQLRGEVSASSAIGDNSIWG